MDDFILFVKFVFVVLNDSLSSKFDAEFFVFLLTSGKLLVLKLNVSLLLFLDLFNLIGCCVFAL